MLFSPFKSCYIVEELTMDEALNQLREQFSEKGSEIEFEAFFNGAPDFYQKKVQEK